MPEKHDLSHNLRKIAVGRSRTNVIQNVSDRPIEWTPNRTSTHYYYLQPGDYLKVNYDVWTKDDAHGVSHLVAGASPTGYTHSYRVDVVANKTYVQTKSDAGRVTDAISVIAEFPELTIQKLKNLKLMIDVPARTFASTFGGLNIQTAMKVNGVDHVLCDSDYAVCDGSVGETIQRYNKTLVVDPIAEGFVDAADIDSPYTIQVKLSGLAQNAYLEFTGGATLINDASGGATDGTVLNSTRNQNHIGVVVEEIDRW